MKKGSKRNRPVHNGIQFDSKGELNDYLYILEHPKLTFVEREPFFMLQEPFNYYCFEKGKERKYGKLSFKPDFKVKLEGLDKPIIWERKGLPKPDYMIRKKLWYRLYGDKYYFVEIRNQKQRGVIFDKYRKEDE